MPRATSSTVGAVIDLGPPESSPNLTPFIQAAHELVNELCLSSGYTDTRLTMIETWLAAHFFTIRDPRVVIESASTVRAEYQSKIDYGLKLSHYGQTAIRLDTAGNLAALDNSLEDIKGLPSGRATSKWLGTPRW